MYDIIQGDIIESTIIHNVTVKWADKSENDKRRNIKCEQLITVILNKYDENREFYDIQYEWKMNQKTTLFAGTRM